MADGSIVISVDADDADAQKKLNQLRKEIEKTEKTINSTTEKRSGIAESLAQAREEAEQTAQKIQDIKDEMSGYQEILMGKLKGDVTFEEFNARREQQQALTSELAVQEKLYAKQSANVAKLEGQEASITSQLEAQTARLGEQKDEAGEVERTLALQSEKTMPNISAAISEVNTNLRKGFKNILKWGFGIRSTFILIRRLRSAIKEGINEYAKSDPETQANLDALKTSLNGVKAAWGAAFAPIVNAVIPLLIKLIGWLQTAADYVNMFFSAISGRGTYKRAIANNNALAKSYGGAGSAAKEAKKQLMGFDEINKLNAEQDSGGGGGGGSNPLADYEEVEIPNKFQKAIDFIKENIRVLETIVGTALLAIGAILLFSWTNPLLGLTMIIAGLAMVADVAFHWDQLSKEMQNSISLILTVIGVSLLAVGAVLLFSGVNAGVGLGLMLAGGIAAGTAVALNWDAVRGFVSESINGILVALGAALLVVGAIFLFSGANIPLGIGLMIAGGISLGAAVALNWDTIHEKIGKVKDKINGHMDKLKAKWEETKTAAGQLKTSIVNKFTEIRDGISEKLTAAKDRVKELIDKIKEFFQFKWELPQIQLPHLTVSWEAVDGNNPIAKLFGIGSIPHFGIQWYAKGGIIDGATLIGAGEAGKEAVVPLERNTEWIGMVARGIVDSLTANNRLGDYISGKVLPSVVSGQIVPPRALAGGGSMFTDGDIDRLVSGITAALTASDSEEHTPVIIDGRVVAEIVTRHQRRMERGFA